MGYTLSSQLKGVEQYPYSAYPSYSLGTNQGHISQTSNTDSLGVDALLVWMTIIYSGWYLLALFWCNTQTQKQAFWRATVDLSHFPRRIRLNMGGCKVALDQWKEEQEHGFKVLEPNGIGDRYLITLPLMNQHAASVFRNSLSVSLTVPPETQQKSLLKIYSSPWYFFLNLQILLDLRYYRPGIQGRLWLNSKRYYLEKLTEFPCFLMANQIASIDSLDSTAFSIF